MPKFLLALIAALITQVGAVAQDLQSFNNHPTPSFFTSAEAIRIGDQILLWQRDTGGWPKNMDMVSPMTDSLRQQVLQDKGKRNDSTTDNGATSQQLTFLAHLYQHTHEKRFRNAFIQGVEYLLSGQYPNGGWPQFWPEKRNYQWHITYNDDAMVNTLTLLRSIALCQFPYTEELTSKKLRKRLQESFDRGIKCILATQIVVDGQPTIWCQQHDHETLLPAPARAYELPSYCPIESAAIVRLLMQLPHPSKEIQRSIHAAMQWFEDHQIQGIRIVPFRTENGEKDCKVVADPSAPSVWARFYDLETAVPFFCDRDGIPRSSLEQIGRERRGGYSWYGNRPAQLFPLYEKWKTDNNIQTRL